VLVVDDHPDAADALAAVLELLDCPVRACHDGPGALAVAAEFQPQVCLLDLMMPGMDGLELAARLRERAGGRPLLLVATTALGDLEARTQTALAGFHDHLTKPVDAAALIALLTRLGDILGCPPAPHWHAPDGG
jgi:CheY-like chemotaxis protein